MLLTVTLESGSGLSRNPSAQASRISSAHCRCHFDLQVIRLDLLDHPVLVLTGLLNPERTKYEVLRNKIIAQKADEQYRLDLRDGKKYVYLIGVGVIASIAAVIAQINFDGHSALNAFVAFAIGFGAYRAQDILKIFPSKEED